MTTYVNGRRVVLPDEILARNLLKVLKVAITSSAALRPITAGEDPETPGLLRLTFRTELAWEYWVRLLGESDDAVFAGARELVNGEWVHRWMSSDVGIVCEHFEVSHATDNFRSHP